MKELQEEDAGDNTEPLEDLFLGLSVEEVTQSVPGGELSGLLSPDVILLLPFSNMIPEQATRRLHFCLLL